MNFAFHAFGNPSVRFGVYPDDCLKDEIAPFAKDLRGQRLVILRRDSVVTYAGFIRLNEQRFIGFSISLSGAESTRPSELMRLMSRAVGVLILQGTALKIADDGAVRYGVASMSEMAHEIESVRAYIGYELQSRPHIYGCGPLHGNPDNDVAYAASSQNDSEIIAMTYRHAVVVVDNEELIPAISSISHGIGRLSARLRVAQEQIRQLDEANGTLRRQKRRAGLIVMLVVLLIAAGGWLFVTNSDLAATREQMTARTDSLKRDLMAARDMTATLRGAIKRISEASTELHGEYPLPSWYSTNGHMHNSESYREYDFYAYPGDKIAFDYSVDSESVDRLFYRLTGGSTPREGSFSGKDKRGKVSLPITKAGRYTLRVSYSKDFSVHMYSDRASVTGVKLLRGGVDKVREAVQAAEAYLPVDSTAPARLAEPEQTVKPRADITPVSTGDTKKSPKKDKKSPKLEERSKAIRKF